jgi:hypothetical protein
MTNVPETILKLRNVLLPQEVYSNCQVSTTLSAFVTTALSNMQVPQCVFECVFWMVRTCVTPSVAIDRIRPIMRMHPIERSVSRNWPLHVI